MLTADLAQAQKHQITFGLVSQLVGAHNVSMPGTVWGESASGFKYIFPSHLHTDVALPLAIHNNIERAKIFFAFSVVNNLTFPAPLELQMSIKCCFSLESLI